MICVALKDVQEGYTGKNLITKNKHYDVCEFFSNGSMCFFNGDTGRRITLSFNTNFEPLCVNRNKKLEELGI